MLTPEVVLFFALGTLAYIYVGYPLILRILVWLRGARHVHCAAIRPRVTLIISAFNEALTIREKLRNALALDYPSDLLEIVVVSDASDDGTDEIVREFAGAGVKLFRQEERRGKTAGLNRVMEELSGGQQKLLEMARMLMPDPKVVMLDEPFAGVHPLLCRFMIEQIEAMKQAGKTVLLISHDLTSIYRLSSRVLALNQGRVIAEGGVEEFARRNALKSSLVYDAIDASGGFYRNEVVPAVRSRMNIPFFLPDETLTSRFVAESKAAGLLALKGHKAVGGIRASLYNALPVEGAQALVQFMQDFQQRNG